MRRLDVDRGIALRSEEFGHERRVQMSEHDLHVGQRGGPTPSVAGGPGVGTRRARTHAVSTIAHGE